MYDKAKIWVEGGAGGDGSRSFRREAHVPRGGPDGGDGGHGGDVVLVCDPSRRDLGALKGSKHFRAQRGRHGEGSNRHGARGEDREISVPPGTQASAVDGSYIDLVAAGQRAVVARGGRGGHGNKRFANSTRQAPRFAEKGSGGEADWIELQLKLLADVGLVGLPNAGKSSLLSRLTRATPKVADYPFTTLSPVLGTIEGEDRQAVIADIPGLIEGAAEGAGLGHRVLGVLAASSATGEGLDELRQRILTELPEDAPTATAPAAAPGEEFEAEHRVYRPAGEGGYWVEREEDGAFRVLGRGVEMLFERHDTKNEEALGYLEQRLKEMGVIAALDRAGFEPGDDVRIGEHEFELHV